MLCHGNGDPDNDGCCYVDGAVCPLRWKIVDVGGVDHVEDANGVDLGSVDSIIASYTNNPNRQQSIRDQLIGVVYLCKAAIDVIATDPNLVNDRPGFEAAWAAHADYNALVRPHWATIENRLGLAPGTYDCWDWKGTGAPQCCFAEDETANSTKASTLTTSAVTIRQAGGNSGNVL